MSVVDENDELFRIVKCRDIAVPQAIVLGSGISKGIVLQVVSEIKVREDDIFICDYSRSGKLANSLPKKIPWNILILNHLVFMIFMSRLLVYRRHVMPSAFANPARKRFKVFIILCVNNAVLLLLH